MNELILVVDDETDTRELLQYNLQKADYQPLIACNGEEALTAARLRQPDLVLLDIMMPELDGWEVCRLLRDNARGSSVPIIMLSALSEEESRIKGLSLGADDYLSKPFSIRELLLKVRKCLDKQQSIRQLQAREQAQDTSLRYLIHELKNSVSVIGGISSVAIRRGNPHHYLNTIKTTALHAESLLNDTSLLSRLESGGEALPVKAININAMVNDAVALFQDMAKKQQIELLLLNDGSSLVLGNIIATRQVLINLLSNAVKFNRDNGKVWITMENNGDWIDISFKDQGCGIGHDELSRVFEKFYRAEGSARFSGSGLGLYIVKRFTEAMGGRLTVMSRLGEGSTFTVSFQKAVTSRDDEDGGGQDRITRAAQ
jgi:signal transduction histidine kinase